MDSTFIAALQASFRGDATSPGDPPIGARSTEVESFIGRVRKSLEDHAPLEAIEDVHGMRQRVTAARLDLEGTRAGSGLSKAQMSLMDRIHNCYSSYLDALEEMERALCGHDPDRAGLELERMRAITAQLCHCQDEVEANVASQGEGTVMVPGHLAELHRACEEVAHGRMSVPEWLKVLEGVDQTMRTDCSKMRAMTDRLQARARADSDDAGIAETAEVSLEAMEEVIDALGQMRNFVHNGEVEHLNQGWTRVATAIVRLQRTSLAMSRTVGSTEDALILGGGE